MNTLALSLNAAHRRVTTSPMHARKAMTCTSTLTALVSRFTVLIERTAQALGRGPQLA